MGLVTEDKHSHKCNDISLLLKSTITLVNQPRTHLICEVAVVLNVLRFEVVLDLLVRDDPLVVRLTHQPIHRTWNHSLDQFACSVRRSKDLLDLGQLRLICGARLQGGHVDQLGIAIKVVREVKVAFLRLYKK